MSRADTRRRLLGGSALAIPVIAALPATLLLPPSAAGAAERMTGSVGGYMYIGAGVTDASISGGTELALIRDGEIHLKARGSSDSGLNFAVQVELEAFTSALDQIDENWARVDGAFGEVWVGGADTALNEYGQVGIVFATGPYNYYDADIFVAPGGVGMVGKDDALSIRYGLPENRYGIRAGVSYQPDATADGLGDTARSLPQTGAGPLRADHQVAVGASWTSPTTYHGFGLSVGGGYLNSDGPAGTEMMHAGAEITYSSGADLVTLAGFWNRRDGRGRTDHVGLGAMYQFDAWKIGGGVMTANGTADALHATFGGTYLLAPGVDVSCSAQKISA